MRVCIVSKFPPVEGGIAARTYWQVRRLLDGGHEVAVVTNSGSVEPEYRIAGCEEHLEWLEREHGLRLHDVPGPVPWHVPMSHGYLERMLNELLGVLGSGEWDVIESGYLVPYGIAGHLASKLTGVPHVVRHGGSDIAKFLKHPGYSALLREVLLHAELVVTDDSHEAVVRAAGAQAECRPVYEPDELAFKPRAHQQAGNHATFAYVGKINHHWRRKGLDRIVDWFALQDHASVSLRVVGQGIGQSDFERWMSGRLALPPSIEPFVPPWEMPRLLDSLDGVFDVRCDNTVKNTSQLAIEARRLGLEVIGLE